MALNRGYAGICRGAGPTQPGVSLGHFALEFDAGKLGQLLPTNLRLFRVMKKAATGAPVCGDQFARLGVRTAGPRSDIPAPNGLVAPNTGGLSTFLDPALIPIEFRPESHGGVGRIPMFSIDRSHLGTELVPVSDPKRPRVHVFIEPARAMPISDYQTALCKTAGSWRPEP